MDLKSRFWPRPDSTRLFVPLQIFLVATGIWSWAFQSSWWDQGNPFPAGLNSGIKRWSSQHIWGPRSSVPIPLFLGATGIGSWAFHSSSLDQGNPIPAGVESQGGLNLGIRGWTAHPIWGPRSSPLQLYLVATGIASWALKSSWMDQGDQLHSSRSRIPNRIKFGN